MNERIKPLPFSRERSPAWAEQVGSWAWQEWNEQGGPREGWRKVGDCPRCGHLMSVYQYETRALLAEDTVNASCNCQEGHPDPTDGDKIKIGCGAAAPIEAHA